VNKKAITEESGREVIVLDQVSHGEMLTQSSGNDPYSCRSSVAVMQAEKGMVM